jgi:hypothetical protein
MYGGGDVDWFCIGRRDDVLLPSSPVLILLPVGPFCFVVVVDCCTNTNFCFNLCNILARPCLGPHNRMNCCGVTLLNHNVLIICNIILRELGNTVAIVDEEEEEAEPVIVSSDVDNDGRGCC